MRQIEAEFANRAALPVKMPVYAVANLPDAGRFKDCWIKVPDEAGGDVAAFSDGAAWRRCTDRAVVS